MPLIPTKGQKPNVTISACEKGRVREMVAALEANEKFEKTRGHALAKAGRTSSDEMANDQADRKCSHVISSSGCAKPKTLNSRKCIPQDC